MRRGLRFATPVAAVAVIAILLFGTGASAACGSGTPNPPYTVLATIPLVDAIAANSSMVFAQGVTNCSDIWGITPSDSVSLYTTVPVSNSACDEGSLALAPNTTYVPSGSGGLQGSPLEVSWGAGGWGHGHCPCAPSNTTLFDVVEGQLFAITENGTNVTPVATFPNNHKAGENFGLAYDQVGMFNHDLIVTSSLGGSVWLVNSTGNVTLLIKLHTYIGGPAVAPKSFWPFGGDIIVAEKTLGAIVAISPSGNVTNVANWSKANAVAFPFGYNGGHGGGGGYGYSQWNQGSGGCGYGGYCTFGPEHYALFVANYSSGAVEAFPLSDLVWYYPDGFVAGGLNQGIGAFNSWGHTSYFAMNTERLSDIASVYCPPPCCGGHGGGGCGGQSGSVR